MGMPDLKNLAVRGTDFQSVLQSRHPETNIFDLRMRPGAMAPGDRCARTAGHSGPIETQAMKFTYTSGARPLEGYTIKRGIGHGGFGEVYYAVSDGGKEVAL